MNISKILSHHVRYRPDHEAFVFLNQRQTYKQFGNEVDQMSAAMSAAGIKKGDKVATILPNTAELWQCYWACAQIGAIVVPLSPLMRDEGLVNLLNGSDVTLVLTKASFILHLEPVLPRLTHLNRKLIWTTDSIVSGYDSLQTMKDCIGSSSLPHIDIDENDIYNIIYSSGTTGQPKGIMLTHRIRAMYMTLFANAFRITPESVVMHSGSIIFNGSFLTIMPVMYQGATFVLMPEFNVADTLAILIKEKVTHTILVPSQIIQMLECPDFNSTQLPHLEMILTVGAPLDKKYKGELEERLPGLFYELYGLTEGFVTILDKTEAVKKMGSVGKPPQFSEMKIVNEQGEQVSTGEVGEIVGKGPLLMKGYYKDEMRTAEAIKDGWLYTGDLGYVDEDGFLFLAGRKKDLIISGGVNVYPTDIESIIVKHPDVLEAAVFGVPDTKWGEAPVAAVVMRNETISASELKEWINERLHVRYQKLSDVIYLKEFPRNVAGKVLKRTITEEYLSRHHNQ